jgi:putative redox protein
MSVEIEVEYVGGLKTRAVHGPSGAALTTTPPKDNAGDGSSFSPTDLAATALATCALSVLAIAARKHGIELEGARAHVSKHMSAGAPRRIVRLPVTLTLPRTVPLELRERLEHVARTCPVAQSLREGLDAEMTFNWEG